MKDKEIIKSSHIKYMQRALYLASKGQGMTSPNPMVGAVLVKNGRIISEGYHKKPGTPHAEAIVISKAKEDARDCTLYVTLEPCCHSDKRTPPCSKAIIKAGIKEVYIAMKDPNPKVSGKGIEELQQHGINVSVGICEDKAKKLNESYIKYITTGKPFVILKIAMTLDGKIATPDGESKWITDLAARKYVHKIRTQVDAILTAIGTVKADNPSFTVRLINKKGNKNPIRIVIDPDFETPIDFNVMQIPPPTILVVKKDSIIEHSTGLANKKRALFEKEGEIIEYEGEKVQLDWLMDELGKRGITSLMIESGSSFSSSCINSGIVDKVIFFIAPKILGGKDSLPAIGGKCLRTLKEAIEIKNLKMRKIGKDIMIEGYINQINS
ncbi:MAG: bifunctional diaminohydroxyphosphoribosylaminopyrimidine deaminase/5-amino-6-(5-phosphoribosylamino)uracil reductase RibD [Thermodesulfovibrionales bacterium]|nr:bifunctional diaminohydroxyphosphoribosylaminopyrimidine deaminase/5-amino-6-(5-phosphoribosylamino)uracil reductase RibD [Thermodesulfovibrionales bacterium]